MELGAEGRTVDRQIYEAAANALAQGKQPDLSEFRTADVDMAMSRAFAFSGPLPSWLEWLKRRVAELSGQRYKLEEADPNDFPYRVKQPGVAYMRLTGPNDARLVIIGPFQPPFQFVS